jgi:CRISPR-associated endoribonuclease Cas6
MPASFELKIKPLEDFPKVPFLGRALHGLALSLVGGADPALAAALHAREGPKPFRTAGPFVAETFRPAGKLRAGETYTLVVAALEDGVGAALKAALGPEARPVEVALDEAVCRVEGVAVEEVRYEELFGRYFPAGPVRRSLELTFDTPAAFHSGGKNVPLPLPELVFGSVLERWNDYAPLTLGQTVREFARECVGIAYYDLKAWAVAVAGGKQVGFVGRVGYRVLRYDPYFTRALNLLADFARFCGVGVKTSMGMGQARRTDGDGALPDRTGEPAEPGRRPVRGEP